MKPDISSGVANVLLAVGVTLAVAIAVGFALGRQNPTPVASATMPEPPATPISRLAVATPVAASPAPPAAKAAAPVAPLPKPVRTAAQRPAPSPAAAPAAPEPFEPPAPPIPLREPAPRVAAAAPPEQVAELPGAGLRPPPVADPSALAPPAELPASDPSIRLGAGDPLPALRSVALDIRELHRVPNRAAPLRRAGTAAAPESKVPRDHRAVHPVAYSPLAAQGGPNVMGSAVVTAALELNVDGRPLRLYGLRLPKAGDMCAPSPAYAARACADASRQALAAYLGNDSLVSCRILAVGGRSALPAVCADEGGHDIGTYLVIHGFALADPNEMLDYSAAEEQARIARAGLWRYR